MAEKSGDLPGFADLELIRTEERLSWSPGSACYSAFLGPPVTAGRARYTVALDTGRRWSSMRWSRSPQTTLPPSPPGDTANSGRSFRPMATTSRCRQWLGRWADVGSSCHSATRRSGASWPGPAALSSLTRRHDAAASGRWTSVSSRQPAAASGGSPCSRLRRQGLALLPRHDHPDRRRRHRRSRGRPGSG